jgi:hypothetical protein
MDIISECDMFCKISKILSVLTHEESLCKWDDFNVQIQLEFFNLTFQKYNRIVVFNHSILSS